MLDKYYAINQATGISVTIGQGSAFEADTCEVSVDNNQLNITKKAVDLMSIETLKSNIASGALVSLNLTGKGILQKKISRTEIVDEAIFNTLLPNGTLTDFYIQNFISGESSFIAMIRKIEADKWIEKINSLGCKVLMLSLGAYPVANVVPQLNFYDKEVTFDGHVITRNEQLEWITYTIDGKVKAPFTLKVESEQLDEKLLIAYSAAFELALSHKLNLIDTPVPALAVALENLQNKRKLKVQGFIALIILFVLLFINYLVLSSLNTDNIHLAERLSRSAQSTSDIETVNQQTKLKEGLLKTIGWEGDVNKSIYIDQLASLMPTEISWKNAAIDPIDLTNSRIQKTITFFSRTISITGISGKVIPVNEWIARIKTKPWVKNAQLNNYVFNTELNTGQFTLTINY